MSGGDYFKGLSSIIIFGLIGFFTVIFGFTYLIYWLINHIRII